MSRRERVLAKDIILTCVEAATSDESVVVDGGSDNAIVPILLMTISHCAMAKSVLQLSRKKIQANRSKCD